jgi:molybdopterin molybdotransferase
MPTTKPSREKERGLDFEDAYRLVAEHAEMLRAKVHSSESVSLLDSSGRTLAEDIVADRDFPPFARATRDGYAVRSVDVRVDSSDLNVVGEIRAGGPSPDSPLSAGGAVSIMTGAPLPDGADAVVMVEYTQREGNRVHLSKPVSAGENFVPRGQEARVGAVLASVGTVVTHQQIALAAAVGKSTLNVFTRPKIAILPTGDEVVPIDTSPADNQIRNSNSFSLAAQVIAAGGEAIQLPIAPDRTDALRELVGQGLQYDLLLLSGGVSAGEYDLVEDVLAQFSAEFLFTSVKIQPGKPLVFGRADAKSQTRYFFGLPGNPISTMVTFELFAREVVQALSGAVAGRLRSVKAQLANPVTSKLGLTRFLPARLSGEWNNPQVDTVKWQGSGDIAAFASADCLLVIPPAREHFDTGEWMTVILL